GRGEQTQFGRFIREPEQRLARIEEGARMRLEGEYGSRSAEGARTPKRGGGHRFVAAMHAVKIADRDGRAAQRLSRRKIAHDAKGFRRHRRPSYQSNSRITPRGFTPAAANMALSAARSGASREPYSSAWIPDVTNMQSRP